MKITSLILLLLSSLCTKAQEPVIVTDSLPAMFNGLKAGYAIMGESEKEVGSKGNFSRYKIRFFIRNTSPEAKIFIKKEGILNSGSAAHDIVQFKCSNATGARLTNKEATLSMQPFKIEAMVEEKECGTEKLVQNKRLADIGYWIKPGETITANTVMIVPLNEKPNMTVIFYPYNNGLVGTMNTEANTVNTNPVQNFVRIKNFASNDYIQNQNGPLACSKIDMNWWSAQWEILPVSGTSNFQIRNRWKNNFLSTENSSLLSDNGKSANAMWQVVETTTSNIYYIKNVADNSKLIFQNGVLKTTNTYNANEAMAAWIIEK
ncbi:MAG: hypothetical protein ABI402_19535 [Ferruginibacter sp.]